MGTLPPQIGRLSKLSHLVTYCCNALFYPFELLNCKKLYVHGDSLCIDLSSLLGRRTRKFPYIPQATEACARSSEEVLGTKATLELGMDVAPCSWCQSDWPSSEFTSWLQGQFAGGDRRSILPLLGRFCSQTCLSAARQKHTASEQALIDSKMESCNYVTTDVSRVKKQPSPFDQVDSKDSVCSEILRIIQSNS